MSVFTKLAEALNGEIEEHQKKIEALKKEHEELSATVPNLLKGWNYINKFWTNEE